MRRAGRAGGILGGDAPHGRAVARLAAAAVLLAIASCASRESCGVEGCGDDRRISGEVRALLEGHPGLEAPNRVSVQTHDRVVYLNGLVDTPYEKELAEALARQAPGTVRVVNLIGVNNGSR
jgi:osmotically-inducible protein OsmY